MIYLPGDLDEQYGLVEVAHVWLFENLLRSYGRGIALDMGCARVESVVNKAGLIKGRLIATDIRDLASAEFLAAATTLPGNVTYLQQDMRDTLFPDSSIDLAIMLGLYGDCLPMKERPLIERGDNLDKAGQEQYDAEVKRRLADSQERLLRETYRILSPGGILVGSNHVRRQPPEATLARFAEFFNILGCEAGTQRYLFWCQKS